jgi:hypothetical protein
MQIFPYINLCKSSRLDMSGLQYISFIFWFNGPTQIFVHFCSLLISNIRFLESVLSQYGLRWERNCYWMASVILRTVGTPKLFAVLYGKTFLWSYMSIYNINNSTIVLSPAKGTQRLNTLVKSLLLRRTKTQKTSDGKDLVSNSHFIITFIYPMKWNLD